ncbi:hypothetical protein HY218_01795 [Candidatus Saccharibacteria bacterium]|nr:hypothetical protein [Candidatus Saccharibacteria bacterium]
MPQITENFRYISESDVLKFLINPQLGMDIDGTVFYPDQVRDSDRRLLGRTAALHGYTTEAERLYGVEVDVSLPGSLRRWIAHRRGEEPLAYASITEIEIESTTP